MNKSIFIDNQHEYDLKTEALYYAENESWVSDLQGKLAVGVETTDDDITFSFDDKEVILDYTEAEQVLILLKVFLDKRKFEIAERREL